MKIKADKNALQKAMYVNNFSSKQLAQELGITTSYMSGITTQRNTLSVSLAHKIADVLNVKFEDLFQIIEKQTS